MSSRTSPDDSNENATKGKSAEEILNLRDLEREKIEKTSEKIMDAISKENYRLVQRYKENLMKLVETWESYHLQYANLTNRGVADSEMRTAHQQVLSASEQAETEAENFYLELKRRKKEEKELQRAEQMEAAKSERMAQRKADQEAKMPILKNFVTSEFKEINKMLMGHSQSIAKAGGKQQPDAAIMAQEIQYLDKRFNETLASYDQYLAMSNDEKEIGKFRDLKNVEERKYRSEMVKVQSYIAKKAPNIEIKGNPNNKSNITTTSKSSGKLTTGIPTLLGADRMANQREILKAFEDNVFSVSMDESHVLAGLSNGKVACIFSGKQIEKFVTDDLSDVSITAVLADTFDVKGRSLFYAGDQRGWLYVLGERGELIDKIKVRDDPIFAILDVEARKVWVYSDKGRSVVRLENNKLVVDANKKSKFSMSLDWTFHKDRKKGDFPLDEFDCKVPSRVYGSPRVLLESVNDGEYINATAYTTDSEVFRRRLIEDNKALPQLDVVGRGQTNLRSVKLSAPVKQLINCYEKQKATRKDALYVLTCDDKITRFKTSELLDQNIEDDDLTKVLVYEDMDDEDEDKDDLGDIESFTVRADTILFIKRDTDEVFIVKDTE